MGVKKRIEITIKKRETFVVRSARFSAGCWCGECDRPSQMITPDEAAVLVATSLREIYRLIEKGALHFVEPDRGSVLICLNSLPGAIHVNPQTRIEQS